MPLVEEAEGKEVIRSAGRDHPHPFVLVCKVLARAREPDKLVRTAATTRGALEEWIRADPRESYSYVWVRLLGDSFLDDLNRTLLIDLARRGKILSTRKQAVESLVEHFRDDATQALLADLARSGETIYIRRQAVAFLAEHFHDADTRALLTELARRDEDTKIWSRAIQSLSEHFRDADTCALLTELARRDEDTAARREAVTSLADHFRDFSETAEALREIVAEKLGRRVVSVIVLRPWVSDAARKYLLSFVRNSGVAEPEAGSTRP